MLYNNLISHILRKHSSIQLCSQFNFICNKNTGDIKLIARNINSVFISSADFNISTKADNRKQNLYKNRRDLSTEAAKRLDVTSNQNLRLEFMSFFPDIINDVKISANERGLNHLSEKLAYLLEYNVPKGKINRGLTTVMTCKTLLLQNQLNSDAIRKINYLGWYVEMIQSMLLILDDIMDHSETRRGQLCWYKQPTIGLSAINDGLFIENIVYALLQKHFKNENYYIDVVELFHETMINTILGQTIDLHTANQNITSFTLDTYRKIVDFKTTFYTFYLPVALALNVAGCKDKNVFMKTKEILYDIGYFFQVQDDYLDCYGDPNVTGKIGTDIQDNKCSWLAVNCMKHATINQRQILQTIYGQNDLEKINEVKKIYDDLKISEIYANFENDSYKKIKMNIQQANAVPTLQNVFYDILSKIYKRKN